MCAAGAAIVPQGGNTGLVGGGVPRGGEVLLSLRRLDRIGAVDAGSAQVDAGAGATLAGSSGVDSQRTAVTIASVPSEPTSSRVRS